MNKAKYTNFDGKKVDFTYVTTLSLSQKANYVMEVAGMVVSSTIGYAYVLREAIFNYCLIKYFTDIELFESPDDFNLDLVDSFCTTNKDSVIETIKKNVDDGLILELEKACDEAIEFRKSHFSDYREEVSDLLAVVREYVVKPDYMNELLVAFTNYLNKASEREIDAEVVSKLAGIVPVLKDMGSVEVAKAIIETKADTDNKTDGSDKPKPKSKSKKVSGKDIEVVK